MGWVTDMAKLFGHEKLKVYQKGLGFAASRKALLDSLPRRVAACDHLDRGAESILVNIAHASSSSPHFVPTLRPHTSSHTSSLTLRRTASSIPGMANGASNPQILRKTPNCESGIYVDGG